MKLESTSIPNQEQTPKRKLHWETKIYRSRGSKNKLVRNILKHSKSSLIRNTKQKLIKNETYGNDET